VVVSVEARPLVLRAVARAFLVGGLVLAAFVAAVVSAASHERHLGQVCSEFGWGLGVYGVWGWEGCVAVLWWCSDLDRRYRGVYLNIAKDGRRHNASVSGLLFTPYR
jgi:hypothetical protein